MSTFTILVFILFFILLVALSVTICNNISLRKQIHTFDEAKTWHRMAYHDNLTGLNNRAAYNQKIEELKQSEQRSLTGIILFDIDNFKNINDTKGHLAGDRVLQTVGSILMEIFSSTLYTLYRIGGDEFAVIGERVTEEELIARLLEVGERFEKETDIRLSKGYSMIGADIIKAFNDADKMLYVDKASKKAKKS